MIIVKYNTSRNIKRAIWVTGPKWNYENEKQSYWFFRNCFASVYILPTVPAPCQSQDNMKWQSQPNPTPEYTGGTEGDNTNLTRISPSYAIISNPSINRKQWNDRSWSDQGSVPTPNNLPSFKQTSWLWVSVASLHSLQHCTELSRKLLRFACRLYWIHSLGLFSTYLFWDVNF